MREADSKLDASRDETHKEREQALSLADKLEQAEARAYEREKELEARVAALETQLANDDGKSNSLVKTIHLACYRQQSVGIPCLRPSTVSRSTRARQSPALCTACCRSDFGPRCQVDRLELEEAAQRAKQRVAEVTAELHTLQTEHKQTLEKLRKSQQQLQTAKEQVGVLKESMQSSSSVAAQA